MENFRNTVQKQIWYFEEKFRLFIRVIIYKVNILKLKKRLINLLMNNTDTQE